MKPSEFLKKISEDESVRDWDKEYPYTIGELDKEFISRKEVIERLKEGFNQIEFKEPQDPKAAIWDFILLIENKILKQKMEGEK